MEKSITVIGRAAEHAETRYQTVRQDGLKRTDHVKAWRQIYQDVRRQWAKAEQGKTGSYRPGK